MQQPIDFDESDILAEAKRIGCSANFAAALNFLLPREGLYFEIVPGDDGGATCCGVTQECYDTFRFTHTLSSQSVQQISALEVASVYFEQNWNALGLDRFQFAVALPLFDTGVNCGNGEAVKFLQRELGIDDDGELGPDTIAAEHDYVVKHGALQLGFGIIEFRAAYYDEIGEEHASDEQFEAGWHARCDDLAAAIKSAAAVGSN